MLRGEAGLLAHVAKCPFRPLVTDSEEEGARKRRKRPYNVRTLPVTLGGSGSRLPIDEIYVEAEDGSGVVPYQERQEFTGKELENFDSGLENTQGASYAENEQSDEEEETILGAGSMEVEDITRALAFFCNSLLNDIGASRVNRLLALVQHPSYSGEASLGHYNSAKTLRSYIKKELTFEGEQLASLGFNSVPISDESGNNCRLYMRDPVETLKRQLEKSSRRNMIYEHVREINRAGERIYNHPLSGKLAEEGFPRIIDAIMQSSRAEVYWDSSGNNFIGPVQLYSDKSMVTLSAKSLTFYPLHVTLLNFKNEFRRSLIQRGETKVAFLPVYMYDAGGNAIRGRETKMKLLHKAIEMTLEPLFLTCWTGFSFFDMDGVPRQCHPCLGNIITDIPEGKDLASVLHGNKTELPCTRCLTRRDDLSLFSESPIRLRTAKEVLRLQEKACALEEAIQKASRREERKRLREERTMLLRSRCVTPVRSALTLWPFLGLHPTLDLYQALTFEPMHNLPLGIGRLLKECLMLRMSSKELHSSEMLTAKDEPRTFFSIKSDVLYSINKTMQLIQTDSSSSGFSVDFQNAKVHHKINGLYTSDGLASMLEASDLLCVDQIFPFIGALVDRLCGEVEEAPTTKVMTMYTDIVSLLYRRNMEPGHSEQDIIVLRNKIKSFKELSCKLYGKYQSSQMRTLKFHMLDHVLSDIECFGALDAMDAGVYESSHKEVKRVHRGTSRRHATAMDETVRAVGEIQALQNRVDVDSESPTSIGFKKIARFAFGGLKRRIATNPTAGKLETVSGGSATLVKKGTRIAYTTLISFLRKIERAGEDARSKTDSAVLAELLSDIEVEGLRSFCKLLSERACLGVENSSERAKLLSELYVERVQSGYVASMNTPTAQSLEMDGDRKWKVFVKESGRRWMKRIVASHSFYGSKSPRMDCVMLEAGESPRGGARTDNLVPLQTEREIYFAKALVLFHAKADGGPLAADEAEERELCFLRYFDIIPLSDNVDKALGCVKLRWAKTSEKSAAGEGTVKPWYDLQSVATFRGVVHVVRGDYCLERTRSYKDVSHWADYWFYVNRFKYNSSEPMYHEDDRVTELNGRAQNESD